MRFPLRRWTRVTHMLQRYIWTRTVSLAVRFRLWFLRCLWKLQPLIRLSKNSSDWKMSAQALRT